MAIDPFTGALFIGGLNAGMNVLGAFGSHAAKRQQYVTDKAFQSANNRFSMWQAGFAIAPDANKQHQFWQDTVNYNQNLAFAHSQRNVELPERSPGGGGEGHAGGWCVLRPRRPGAAGPAGRSGDERRRRPAAIHLAGAAGPGSQPGHGDGGQQQPIVQDHGRQLGDQMTLEAINEDIRDRQYTRAQAGQVQQYLGRWNSQQFYEEAQVFDPIAPFPPLPSLITPPPPSRTGAPPSTAALALDIGTGIVGGVNTGFSTYTGLKGLQ